MLAGIPWFLDWGRDAMIAYEGILLKTKRFEIAKQLLLTFTRDVKFGLVPNGYSGFDNRPLYNSADASLLLFEQINKYLGGLLNFSFESINSLRQFIFEIQNLFNVMIVKKLEQQNIDNIKEITKKLKCNFHSKFL